MSTSSAPGHLLLVITVSIFISETICMFLLKLLPPLPEFLEILADAIFLIFMVFPVLYYFSYRALLIEVKERRKAQNDLLQAHEKLEERVEKRTSELAQANSRLKREIDERKRVEQKLLSFQAKLRSFSSELSLTEERERRRIATDLHDRIGQNLAAISITKLGALRDLQGTEKFSEAYDEVWELMDQTLQATRALIFELSPPILHELGLEAALEWTIEQLQKQNPLRIGFHYVKPQKSLDLATRGFIYQAVRELLGNVTQHARATQATVSIHSAKDVMRIDVEDNGIGFNTNSDNSDQKPNKGLGLFKIRERLHYLGGRLEILSESGKGTRATLWAPLKDCN